MACHSFIHESGILTKQQQQSRLGSLSIDDVGCPAGRLDQKQNVTKTQLSSLLIQLDQEKFRFSLAGRAIIDNYNR